MSEEQDYTVHFADPDTLVNWDFVEQVVSSDGMGFKNLFIFLSNALVALDIMWV